MYNNVYKTNFWQGQRTVTCETRPLVALASVAIGRKSRCTAVVEICDLRASPEPKSDSTGGRKPRLPNESASGLSLPIANSPFVSSSSSESS